MVPTVLGESDEILQTEAPTSLRRRRGRRLPPEVERVSGAHAITVGLTGERGPPLLPRVSLVGPPRASTA